MIIEVVCLLIIAFCIIRIYKIKTGKISPTIKAALPAYSSAEEQYRKTIETIRKNREKRKAGEYIPNYEDNQIRKYLKSKLKPEIVKDLESKGEL